jgi:small-conductance mechanosensitive channel
VDLNSVVTAVSLGEHEKSASKVYCRIRSGLEIVAANPCVLKEPAPLIGISELADSSVTLSIQPWVVVADMITARAELYQAIIERFRASKIDIPYPQRELRLLGVHEKTAPVLIVSSIIINFLEGTKNL